MQKFIVFILLMLISNTVLYCSEKPVESQSQNPSPTITRSTTELTSQEISAMASSNKFGINLFREVIANTPAIDNIFISPLSVSYALAMCYNGAAGETRDAIGTTLKLDNLSIEKINQAFRNVTQILIQADSLVDLRVANSFWSRMEKPIQSDFINLTKAYFDARVEEIDFQLPQTADTINAWVDRATNGKITEMVKPPISGDIAAMLFNAIYFKGSWMYPFDTAYTRNMTFQLADGSETECQMMHLSEQDCLIEYDNNFRGADTNISYYEDEEVFVLGMPYGDGDFRMSIIVPNTWYNYPYNDTSKSIDKVISGLTMEKWTTWMSGGTAHRFNLALPRFKFEYDVNMKEILKILGMEIAFTPNSADFSNMFADSIGWIDEVKHKTFVQVDEKGTEAAAVTQVIFPDSIPPAIICNRPFLIVIHEDNSGAILFMGRIANPVWEK